MTIARKTRCGQLLFSASILTLGLTSQPALAQNAPVAEEPPADEIVVSGIRASLRASLDVKRNAQGVVDAISAEDIGKFPDTNLAESLQRITGSRLIVISAKGPRSPFAALVLISTSSC